MGLRKDGTLGDYLLWYIADNRCALVRGNKVNQSNRFLTCRNRRCKARGAGSLHNLNLSKRPLVELKGSGERAGESANEQREHLGNHCVWYQYSEEKRRRKEIEKVGGVASLYPSLPWHSFRVYVHCCSQLRATHYLAYRTHTKNTCLLCWVLPIRIRSKCI